MALKRSTQEGETAVTKRINLSIQEEVPTTKGAGSSRLLDLPAELRISIYEYALLESFEVEINLQLQQPGLLRVSRQVRREALGIWYTGNTFEAVVWDCDATLACKFRAHVDDLGFDTLNHYITLNGIENWDSLMCWCRTIFHEPFGSVWLDQADDADEYEAMVMAAHTIAREVKPWETCEVALKSLRFAVGKLSLDWLR